MAVTQTALTWDEFLTVGKPGQRWEYIDRQLQFRPPRGAQHGMVNHKIAGALGSLDAAEWTNVGADVAFTMANGDWLCPDAATFRRDRHPAPATAGPVPFPPNVAFEVIAKDDLCSHVQRKRRAYRQNGVVQVWVDPAWRTVEVISPTRGARSFEASDTVVIEELPEFELNLFPLPSPSIGRACAADAI